MSEKETLKLLDNFIFYLITGFNKCSNPNRDVDNKKHTIHNSTEKEPYTLVLNHRKSVLFCE